MRCGQPTCMRAWPTWRPCSASTYTEALEHIWQNIVDTRMHITGGLGAVHGIEGFGPEYFLPNDDAFNETCAAVGNVFFNWRMFLLHRDAKYLDVAEVALYNNVLAGVNFAGDRFFYINPLAADGYAAVQSWPARAVALVWHGLLPDEHRAARAASAGDDLRTG